MADQLRVPVKGYVFAVKGMEGAYLGEQSTHAELKDAVQFVKKPVEYMHARQILYRHHPDVDMPYWRYEAQEVILFYLEVKK